MPATVATASALFSLVRDRISSPRALERSTIDCMVAELFFEFYETLGSVSGVGDIQPIPPISVTVADATNQVGLSFLPFEVIPLSVNASAWPWTMIEALPSIVRNTVASFGLDVEIVTNIRALAAQGAISNELATVLEHNRLEVFSIVLSAALGGPALVTSGVERYLTPARFALQPTALTPCSPYATISLLRATLKQCGFVEWAARIEQTMAALYGGPGFCAQYDPAGLVYAELSSKADQIVQTLLYRPLPHRGNHRLEEIVPFFDRTSYLQSLLVAEEILTKAELASLVREISVLRSGVEHSSQPAIEAAPSPPTKSRRAARQSDSASVPEVDLWTVVAGCRIAYEVASHGQLPAALLSKASRAVLLERVEQYLNSPSGSRLQRHLSAEDMARLRQQRQNAVRPRPYVVQGFGGHRPGNGTVAPM